MAEINKELILLKANEFLPNARVFSAALLKLNLPEVMMKAVSEFIEAVNAFKKDSFFTMDLYLGPNAHFIAKKLDDILQVQIKEGNDPLELYRKTMQDAVHNLDNIKFEQPFLANLVYCARAGDDLKSIVQNINSQPIQSNKFWWKNPYALYGGLAALGLATYGAYRYMNNSPPPQPAIHTLLTKPINSSSFQLAPSSSLNFPVSASQTFIPPTQQSLTSNSDIPASLWSRLLAGVGTIGGTYAYLYNRSRRKHSSPIRKQPKHKYISNQKSRSRLRYASPRKQIKK